MTIDQIEEEITEENWFESLYILDPHKMDPNCVFCQQDKDPNIEKILSFCQPKKCPSLASKSLLEFKPEDSKHRHKHNNIIVFSSR